MVLGALELYRPVTFKFGWVEPVEPSLGRRKVDEPADAGAAAGVMHWQQSGNLLGRAWRRTKPAHSC
jgi:hypothetical protein